MATLLEKINDSERTTLVLSDYIKIKHGYAFKGEDFSLSPTSDVLVTPGNFAIGGGFKADKLKYYKGTVPEDYILKPGDLVVTMTDLSVNADTLGFSAVIPPSKNYRFLHNQRVGLVQSIKEGVDLGYLHYLMRTRAYQKFVVSTASGSTVKHTSPDRIASYEYDFPPLPIQQRVAQILKSYEDKIENNNVIIKNLETTAQTIFNEWFVNFRFPGYEKVKIVDSEMGEIPERWSVGNIETICNRLPSGIVFKEDRLFSSGNVPVYDQSSKGIIGFHNEEPAFHASIDKPILIFGDHTCRTQLVCEPFSLGPNTISLSGKNEYSPIFSFFSIKDLIEQREYKRHWNELTSYKLVVPPAELVELFVEKINIVIEKIVASEKENIALKSQRDLLLAKLI